MLQDFSPLVLFPLLFLPPSPAEAQGSSTCPAGQYMNKVGSPPGACGPITTGALPPITPGMLPPITPSTLAGTLGPPGGRLSPVSHNPLFSGNTTTSTIFYSAYTGVYVPVESGVSPNMGSIYLPIPNGEVSDVLPASGAGVTNTGAVFDEWGTGVGGLFKICHSTNGAGLGWSGDTGGSVTARGSGYSLLDYQWNSIGVNFWSNGAVVTHCYNGPIDLGPFAAHTLTYLGTAYNGPANAGQIIFNTTGAGSGGATGTSAVVMGLWNAYNSRRLTLSVVDNGATYTYTTGGPARQARGSTGNNIQIVNGLTRDAQTATLNTQQLLVATAGTATVVAPVLDNVAVNLITTGQFCYSQSPAAAAITTSCSLTIPEALLLGLHTYYSAEQGDGTHANNFDSNTLNTLYVTMHQ